MIITVHLSDGRKITKDAEHLIFFRDGLRMIDNEDIKTGYICVNQSHIVDVRPAEEDEIKHAEIHGW